MRPTRSRSSPNSWRGKSRGCPLSRSRCTTRSIASCRWTSTPCSTRLWCAARAATAWSSMASLPPCYVGLVSPSSTSQRVCRSATTCILAGWFSCRPRRSIEIDPTIHPPPCLCIRMWHGWADRHERDTHRTHMINLVTINGEKHAVDVGFGRDEPLIPVPLRSGFEFTQVHPQRGRLEYRALKQHTDQTQRMWVYSSQATPGAEWVERNCFNEVEWFPEDYRVSNHHTMSSPTSFFVQNVLAFRGLLDEESGRIHGLLTLFRDTVKRQMAGQEAEVLETLKSEEERVRALDEYFGVRLAPAEQRGIRGMSSELRG
ncbi:hypothetical protein JDV02_002422 [Purpureocillium takamizusanense]|uniref:Arylamine N-acetyltransferase n=1 Tax=Purpureocillium takamizusanense TaxID=2060973 RepID=A0A9Q8Q9B3_9HYPO|nr:uncharacterized protein JDV02_002422 [Purpureocillium takamizusanense]UNI15938.1 hypothetical protein JDV02_002422 [Purpureocillium takamizusanense]